MDTQQKKRSYTLDQAAEELHLSREVITEVLERMNISLTAESNRELTEDEVSRVMELLNSPAEAKLT